jgi:hypothetical protein
MVAKFIIKNKICYIKSVVSEKKEDVHDKINEMKMLTKDKDGVQVKPGKWRKLAPKLFV